MKSIYAAIIASVLAVLLLALAAEAEPIDENQALLDRATRSALDEPLSDDELFELILEYLTEKQQNEDPIYASKRLSGIPGLDSLSMISRHRGVKLGKLGRRRRSVADVY